MASLKLHTGASLPEQLVMNAGNWAQEDLTPGWLASLPATVAALCEKWRIEIDTVVPDTYITLVLLGQSAELGPVVIKSSPLADEFVAEATALRLGAGANVSRLYDVDLDRSVMVVERIVPGTQLRQVDMPDEEATRLAAETVATFWRPVADPAGLHPLRRWMRELFEWPADSTLLDAELVRQAQEIGTALLAQSSRACLLHGDFQHHNLLQRASGEWAIIDPKGLVGDPGFEIAAWMYNPPGVSHREDYLDIVAKRIPICSGVWGIDPHELIAWAFVGSVLSICWTAASDAATEEWLVSIEQGARRLRALLR